MNKIHFPLKQTLLSAPIIADAAPWQTVVRRWAQSEGLSIYAVGIPILRAWMKEHPGDATTAERLARWEHQLNQREAA